MPPSSDTLAPNASATRPRVPVGLVEDNSEYRQGIADWLATEPAIDLIGAFPEVASALASLSIRPARVLLLDVNLPGISGVDGIRKILDVAPAILIIMLTAFKDDAKVFASFRAGAVGFLLKSADRGEILDAINDAVDGGSPMSGSIARIVVRSMQADNSSVYRELSVRERELLELFSSGLGYKEVAEKMRVSINTVRSYSRRVYEKLQATSRMEAVNNYNKIAPPHPKRRAF